MKMKKVSLCIILIALLSAGCAKTQSQTPEASGEGLTRGLETVVEYDNAYDKIIESSAEARRAIEEYGYLQKDKYDSPKVKKIESRLEKKYDIFSVTLGEVDVATAKDIEKACNYMFKKYPMIKGTLTNLTIANFPDKSSGNIAVTDTREFMINEYYGKCPFVTKYEISLSASKFLKRDKLLLNCKEQVEQGHWPKGTDISALVVHELGHQVLDVIAMKEFGLYEEGKEFEGYYITEENQDAYARYITDSLSANQEIPQRVLNEAYEKWLKDYGGEGDEAAFRGSISEYAKGVQSDGGISYTETVAEAVTDVYLNGRKASKASLAICDILIKYSS